MTKTLGTSKWAILIIDWRVLVGNKNIVKEAISFFAPFLLQLFLLLIAPEILCVSNTLHKGGGINQKGKMPKIVTYEKRVLGINCVSS